MADDDHWSNDPDASDDFPEDDDDATIPCPYCGEDVHEDSPRCPHCERYLSDEDAPPERKPWWIVVGAAVCLYIVYRWSFG